MNLDNIYITLFGLTIYEPMVIVTNLIFLTLCSVYSRRLARFNHAYATHMSWFLLLLGFSSIVGALAHSVQYQLGDTFFTAVVFIMNALSLFSIYFCFRAAYSYYWLHRDPPRRYIYIVMAWLAVLLVICIIGGNFLLIKIHAGIGLLYSMITHYIMYRRTGQKGNMTVIYGILISFSAIIAHSLHLSIHKWFNYKDISHVIMIISLVVIYRGILLNSQQIEESGDGRLEARRAY